MATMMDYVRYYKNVSFDEVAFNDLDSLIFTQIVYADLAEIVPNERGKYILFSDAVRLFLKKFSGMEKKLPRFMKEVYELLKNLRENQRYQNVRMYHYVKIVDHEKQFCAVTLRLPGMVYVAFEGTDTSIIGWKEDFMLTNVFPVPAQRCAISYLNDTIGIFDSSVFVGGHSKGGNLAMISSMLASPKIRMKIKKVYNFDGPGVRKKEFESTVYKRMCRKLKMFVPEDSTVGMLLMHPKNYSVIKSHASGLWQHNPFTWECFGGIFVSSKLTSRSENLEKSNLEFIGSLDEKERGRIIEVLFSIFEKLEITDTSQIKIPKLNQAISLIKEIKAIDSDSRKKLITLFKMLIKGL